MSQEFKIARLRYNWAGVWAANTTYNRDDVAQYGGKTYVCLIPHTANTNFYNDLNHVTGSGASTPYWQLSIDGQTWKQAWTPNTFYNLGNIVTFGGVVYICTTQHTSGASTIDLSNWTTYAKFDNWHTAWAINTIYGVGDVVRYGPIVYICNTNHVSASTTTLGLEADQSKWTLINNGKHFKGSWAPNIRYKANEIVKQGPNTYITYTGHTSSSVFNDAGQWTLFIPGIEFMSTWNSNYAYQVGDTVNYGGYDYVSKTINNTGNVPSIDATDWALLNVGFNVRGDWSAGNQYKIGDVVRRNGRLYEAAVDNSGQDPTGYTVSTTVTSTTTTTTLVVGSTAGITVGMIVIAAGYSLAQRVVSITNSTTLVTSQPPDGQTLQNGAITFAGINYTYWTMLSTGNQWNNRWVLGNSYSVGDIVVWNNATYTCLQNHTANQPNRPDIDTSHAYWGIYVLHARKNASNTTGDIETYSNGSYTAIPIGGQSLIFRATTTNSTTLPAWANLNLVPAVYYVAPNGTDRLDYGTTYDHPWKTIAYACNFIKNGTLFQNTAAILNNNKLWLVTEMYYWMIYQKSQANAPFNASSTFDQTKTLRDAEYIIDAIVYDMTRGGNSQTVAATLAYFKFENTNTFINATVAAEMPYFIAALQQLLSTIVTYAIQNVAPSTNYQSLAGIPAGNQVTQTFGGQADGASQATISSLMNIVITALSTQSTAAVPQPNQGITATIFVKTGTYSETLPITIPENTAVVGDELRGTVIQPKVVINETITAASSATNKFTTSSIAGMYDQCPVQFGGTIGGVTAGTTYYIIGTSISGKTFSISATPGGTVLALTDGTGSMLVYGGDALNNMFYMRNGSGLRNCTVTGLLGFLGAANAYGTQRPTGGAYCSLDPGSGPNDTTVWIFRRSPYIQNVTTFGTGCVGYKVDGTLHNGGNKSIVTNDFTQVLSDGIGLWCTGPGALTEAVSVFSYYGYAGYFAEAGGRIRATNGNSSYGTYGCVAEGYDITEVPVSGIVFNQSTQVQASVQSSLGTNAQLVKFNFANSGSNYVTTTTNLLNYSNNYLGSSWTTDNNLVIQKNTTAPSGNVEAWGLTGGTSGPDGSYIYQNINIQPSGYVYTNIGGNNLNGSGTGATFNITVTATAYVVTVNSGGSGYVSGNQILISGGVLGGQATTNDCIITVQGLTGSTVVSVSSTGTVPTGSALNYTLSLYVKKGTASSIDLYGTFFGTSPVTSSINYNFTTGVVTPSSTLGGMTPSRFGAQQTAVAGWYRIWMAIYDVNGQNNQLQYRIYPRGYSGTSGNYTYVYGSQTEITNTSTGAPGFYQENTVNKFTAYANFNIVGSGTGAIAVADELRSGAVFQTRVTDPGTGSGGAGYLTASNNAQGGTSSTIILAQSDTNTATNYLNMRVFVNSGTGAGQFGFISAFDPSTKTVQVLKESFDLIRVISTASTTNLFTIDPTYNTSLLYANQPIQFIPTYYTTAVSSTSLGQVTATSSVGGVINQLTVSTTNGLSVGMAVTFSGTTFTTIVSNYVYYIYAVVDATHIQLTAALGGSVWPLSADSGSMVMNFTNGTSYLTGTTINMSVNYPISFTGTALGGITVGTTYYIQDIIDASTFTISSLLNTFTITNTNAANSYITTSTGTAAMLALNPIVFSAPTLGGLIDGQKYYISKIIDTSNFTISTTILSVTATATAVGSNLIFVSSTAGFVVNNPIKFIGAVMGGLVAEQTYYVLVVNDAVSFTVSSAPGGSAIGLTTATGSMTVRTCPTSFTPGTASGTMTATSTASKKILSAGVGAMNGTFSTSVFGGVNQGQTYYIKTIGSNNFTVSATSSGPAVSLVTKSGSMNIGMVGWDHITPGTPARNALDSSSVYYIEPRTTFTDPPFNQVITTSGTVVLTGGALYSYMAYGGNYWIALPNTNTVAAGSSTGSTWSALTLPISANWTGIAYGNGYWVAISSGGTGGSSQAIYSNSNGRGWRTTNLPSNANWTGLAYGNGTFVCVVNGAATAAYSTNFGLTWAFGNNMPSGAWTAVTYGNGVFVAVAGSSSSAAAYSTDGVNWNSATLPSSANWSGVVYGNGRFVAISATAAGTAYSFDGINWLQAPIAITATSISYGQGIFVALNSAATTTGYTSEDGIFWKLRTVTNDSYGCLAFGFQSTTYTGVFATLSQQNVGSLITAGARAKGRAVITSGVITQVTQWEAGSNYSAAPGVTFTDPNITSLATVNPRIGSGALGNPSWYNKGTGYNSNTTSVSITGNGYADQYQTGLTIILNNLTRLPSPGDNLTITGISQVYKVTSASAMFGTTAPNLEANVQISPAMTTALSPSQGTSVQIRTKYSQVRLTNHDFLNIGYGNFINANYPGVPASGYVATLQNQTVEVNFGRVFFTSTDQDGNFKVGNLFGVQQATGIVTLSASQFSLGGLNSLSLGGIAVGGNSVTITQFSTDQSFVANSDAVLPTQKAIKAYLTSRLSQGGSNTFTGQLTAGSISVGAPNKIFSTIPNGTAGSQVKMLNKVNFTGALSGVDGNMAALLFWKSTWNKSAS
jgi:hypothetical protein